MNIYEGAKRTRTVTNDGDDGNPAPQFLVSKTYLGGKKNENCFPYSYNEINQSDHQATKVHIVQSGSRDRLHFTYCNLS